MIQNPHFDIDDELEEEKSDSFAKETDAEYEAYLQNIKAPSASENNLYLQEYHENPSVELRNLIVEKNLRLVISIARDYAKINHVSIDDLVQEGSLGLMNAVQDYDITLGYAFSTFATPYIKNAIRGYLSKHSRMIAIPNWLQTRKRKVQNAREQLKLKLEREPTDEEVVQYLDDGTSLDDIADLGIFIKDVYSLDQNIRPDDEDKGSLYDVVADTGYSPSEISSLLEQTKLFKEAIDTLQPREKEIFLARNFDEENGKLKDLAKKFNLSNERIRQIDVKAKKEVLDYIKKRL